MTEHWKHWLRPLALSLPAACCGGLVLMDVASGQNAPPPTPAEAKEAAKDTKDAAKDAAKDTKDAAKDTAKDAKDAAKDTKDAAKDTAKDVKDTAKDAVKDPRGTIQDANRDARDTIRDTRQDTRDTARDARQDARDTIRDTRDNTRDARNDARENARDTVRDPRDPKNPARDQSRDARDIDNVRAPRANTRDVRGQVDADVQTSFRAEGVRSADFGLWFERNSKDGLVISDVASKGAIAKLGFREGDRIVSVAGHKVTRESDFVTYLFDEQYRNERIKVIVIRDGREEVIMVQPTVFIEELSHVDNDPLENFGVIVDDRYNDRIVVWRVIPRSPAFYAGIRTGDVLMSVGNQRLANVGALVKQLSSGEAGEMQLQIGRGQATRNVTVDLPRFEARTARRTTLRPNFEAIEERRNERRDDRIDRRDERVDDRRDRIEDRRDDRQDNRLVPPPRVPSNVPTPGVTPAPAPAPAPAAPAPKNPSRPGLFPRR